MKTLIVLAVVLAITALVWVYAVVIRPWLRYKPWAQGFFEAIERFEIAFYSKSESILWARWRQGLGVILTLIMQLGSVDLALVTPFIPDRYKWIPAMIPMLVSLAGAVAEWQRRDTTKPVELVAVNTQTATPEVKQALVTFEVAKVEAKAAVEVSAVKDRAEAQIKADISNIPPTKE